MQPDLLKYQKLTDLEHILKRPNTYIGSISTHNTTAFVIENNKAVEREITYNPALLKLCDEILSNSVDEHIKTGAVTSIEVNIYPLTGTISVTDNGGIPVVKHPEYNEYIPSMIFGELRTGSNFEDEDRPSAGMNGLGSKLVSIFSSTFKIRTCDGKNELTQIFTKNLSHKTKPAIKKSTVKGTTIEFTPDYDRLKCSLDADNYAKIVKRVYDIAGCNPLIRVKLNGDLVRINNFKQYTEMFSDEVVMDKSDKWEIGVIPSTDDTFKHVSFINGIDTYVGGTHIDYVTNQIVSSIREHIKKKHKIDIKPNNIKQQITVFINGYINAPLFDSQTKSNMTSEVKEYGSSYTVSPSFVKKILASQVVANILAWAQNESDKKDRAEMRKLEKKIKPSEKYYPATKKKDILFACEGASAIGSFIAALGRENYGYYEMKGKPLNAYNATVSKFRTNVELKELYNLLCTEGYDYFIFATDQDLDGAHIRMLLIAFIIKYLPELKGRVGFIDTPVIVVKKKDTIVRWYYSLNNKVKVNAGEELQYYKGLGTWEEKDLQYVMEKEGIENMIKLLAFDNEQLYINWIDEEKAQFRKDELSKHTFNIAMA